jgi:hypothetical protein
MKTEGNTRTIGPNLQHIGCGNRDRRPTTAIVRVVIRDEHAERIVATAQIEDDEVLPSTALRSREIREKRRRCEADRERRHAAAHEFASGDGHVPSLYTSW